MQLYDMPQVNLALSRLHARVSPFVYLQWASIHLFVVKGLGLVARTNEPYLINGDQINSMMMDSPSVVTICATNSLRDLHLKHSPSYTYEL